MVETPNRIATEAAVGRSPVWSSGLWIGIPVLLFLLAHLPGCSESPQECESECSQQGLASCSDGELKICTDVGGACLKWSDPTDCETGQCANEESCFTCDHQCDTGHLSCEAGELSSCAVTAKGCRVLNRMTCEYGCSASADACAVCIDRCSSAGVSECNDGSLRTCETGSEGCLVWSPETPCADGFCSDAETCGQCAPGCSEFGEQCVWRDVWHCVVAQNGCGDRVISNCAGECNTSVCSGCTTITAPAQRMVNLGVPVEDVEIVGTTAFVTTNRNGWMATLASYNLDDPTDPQLLDWVGYGPTSDWWFTDIEILGDYAYVVAWLGGLYPIDIIDPSNMVLEPFNDLLTPGYARSLTIDGTWGYVADTTGLQIVDLAVPGAPVLAGSAATTGDALGVVVVGATAYVAAGDLAIIDVSNKAAPGPVIELATAGDATCITHISDHLYLASGGSGVVIVSIEATPAVVGEWTPHGDARGVYADPDGRLVVATDAGAIERLDVSTPASPSLIRREFSTETAHGMEAMAGKLVFAVAEGLQILSRDPLVPPRATVWPAPDSPRAFHFAGDYGYLVGELGLEVLDLQSPTEPASLALDSISESSYARAQRVGSHLFVAAGEDGIKIYDVSDPSVLSLAGTYEPDPDLDVLDVEVAGPFAYAVGSYGMLTAPEGLQIIDVSDPANPTKAGGFDLGSYGRDVDVVGNLAYVATRDKGMRVIDISRSHAPTLAGQLAVADDIRSLVVVDDTAYLAVRETGLMILDVREPAAPAFVALHPIAGLTYSVASDGRHAYVGTRAINRMMEEMTQIGFPGVQILDVSTPTAPIPVDSFYTPGGTVFVTFAGNQLAAVGADGLHLFQLCSSLL